MSFFRLPRTRDFLSRGPRVTPAEYAEMVRRWPRMQLEDSRSSHEKEIKTVIRKTFNRDPVADKAFLDFCNEYESDLRTQLAILTDELKKRSPV